MSQAVVGATAAQVFLTDRLGKQAFACGAVGGLLPDLDVLICSTSDPLLAVEMRRSTCSPPTARCGCGRSAGRVSSSTGCQSWTRSSPFPH